MASWRDGPGDPEEVAILSANLINAVYNSKLPLFGICLGHQIIGLTYLKAKTEKMKQGHRGINHPIKNLLTGKIEISSQNHGYVVKNNSNIKDFISHISLFDGTIAGFYLKKEKIMSVQYHPEASPGTHDSRYLFEDFYSLI